MENSFIAFILSISFYTVSTGQIPYYKKLIDTAKSSLGLFIGSRPLTDIKLNLSDTTAMKEFLEGTEDKTVDTKTFQEIIINSSNMDTTFWTDEEIDERILVSSRQKKLNLKCIESKLDRYDHNLKKLVKKYNNTHWHNRNIYYLSKPVFNNSKTYAVVAWDNAHSGLGGGGALILLRLEGDRWKTIGNLSRWRH